MTRDLERLGVCTGDTVMVHASLRRLGPVEGGAEGVITALDQAVGSEGTLLMVLGARDDWAWVNERPEPERAALLRDAEPFDAQATSADLCSNTWSTAERGGASSGSRRPSSSTRWIWWRSAAPG